MRNSIRYFNSRLLLLVGVLGAFSCAVFFAFKAQAQQNPSNTNTSSSPAASPSPVSSPTPIPLSLIVSEKEKTERRLGEINKIFSDQLPVVRLQTEVSALTEDFDEREQSANNLIAANPSLDALAKNESYWGGLSLSLPSRKNRVQTQAAQISAQLTELQNMRDVWELTAKSLDTPAPTPETVSENPVNATVSTNKKSSVNAKSNANINADLSVNTNTPIADTTANSADSLMIQLPGNLKQQISDIIEKIKQTQETVKFKFGEVIKLQEKVSDTEKRTNAMLGRISVARAALLSNLVVRDAPPFWSGENFAPPFEQAGENSFVERFAALRNYFSENRGLFLVHLLIIAALILVFRQSRRKTRLLVKAEPKLKNGLIIFEHPFASALLLGLFIGPLLYRNAPDLLGLLVSPFLVLAIFFLFRHLVERPYLPILVALVALYLVNDARLLIQPIPILARTVFLLEMLGGIAFLVWLIRFHQPPPEVVYAGTIRKIAELLVVPFVFALLANILGYVALAEVVGRAIVFSLSFGLILYALVRVADSLLIFVFRLSPFSKLGMVRHQRPLVQKKIFQIIKWLAILVWLLTSLSQTYLLNPFINSLRKILAFEIGNKTVSISLESILSFVFIVWFSFLLSRLLRFALEQDVYPRVHLASGLPYAASTILHYLVLLGGVFLALAAGGVDLTKFTIFLGALGVGVGIGLQNIVENFISGLILLVERPVKIGDAIQMKQHQGELSRIGLRASIVKTFDGGEVIVPNSQLISEEVTNWTLSDERRRLDIDIGVEYGADPEQVIELLETVAVSHPEIDRETAPRALFLGFGESALNFQLRAWTANHDNWIFIKSDLTVGVYKTLKEARIEIPFPQRDLHLKSIDEKLLNNMNLRQFEKLKDEDF